MKKPTPEELIQYLLTRTERHGKDVTEKLLEAFWKGFPVRELEPLFQHPDMSVVHDAAYMLSELGIKGADLVGLSVELLEHPLEDVRAAAISNLLSNSARCGPDEVWSVVSRYAGETQRIREDIVDYIARVPLTLLRDAVSSRAEGDADSHLIGFRLQLQPAVGATIQSALESDDAVVRGYALAATRRLEIFVHQAWRLAARSSDSVLRSLASIWLPK